MEQSMRLEIDAILNAKESLISKFIDEIVVVCTKRGMIDEFRLFHFDIQSLNDTDDSDIRIAQMKYDMAAQLIIEFRQVVLGKPAKVKYSAPIYGINESVDSMNVC